MRLGLVLLTLGFFLCISIAWAALGFFLMGLGLLCLLVAEERNKRVRLAPLPDQPDDEPSARSTQAPVLPNTSQSPSSPAFDEDRWRSLIENDPDLARLVGVLAPFGQKYVDQLAQAYLVREDKAHLPTIIKEIVASAWKDAGKEPPPGPAASKSGAPAAEASARRTSYKSLQAVHEVLSNHAIPICATSETDGRAGSALPTCFAAEEFPEASPSANQAGSEIEAAAIGGAKDRPVLQTTMEAPAVDAGADRNLADLLGRLELNVISRSNR